MPHTLPNPILWLTFGGFLSEPILLLTIVY